MKRKAAEGGVATAEPGQSQRKGRSRRKRASKASFQRHDNGAEGAVGDGPRSAGQALRQAAVGLSTSKSALGAYFRRMAGRLGKTIAIKATAHKLARLVYAALTKGIAYVDRGMAAEEERYRQRALEHLAKRAAALGYSLSPAFRETMSQNAVKSTVGGCVS